MSFRNPIGSIADLSIPLDQIYGVLFVYRNNLNVLNRLNLWNIDFQTARLRDIERVAQILGGQWKISITALMWNATWERKNKNEWVCTQAGRGLGQNDRF